MKLRFALVLTTATFLTAGCATTGSNESAGPTTSGSNRKISATRRATRAEIRDLTEDLQALDVLRKAWGDSFDADDLKGPLNPKRLARILLASPQEYSIKAPSILDEIRQAKAAEVAVANERPIDAPKIASSRPFRLPAKTATAPTEPGRGLNEAPPSLKRLETLETSKL
ncbi:MAG: hypothetical protein AAB250_14825, partial [Bdellovibrionota bacterium]